MKELMSVVDEYGKCMKNMRFGWVVYGFVAMSWLMSGCAVKNFQHEGIKFRTATELVDLLFDSPDVHSGILVVKADSDQFTPLVDYNSNMLFTPASNTKILTLASALKFLSERLEGLAYVRHGDTTYFRGTGDPGFLDPRFYSEDVLSFLKNKKTLVFISDWETDQRWGSGWSWDDYPYYYSPQLASFPLYGNMVRVWCDDERWHFSPSGIIFNKVHLPGNFRAKRQEFSNIFQVNTALCTSDTIRIPFVWTPQEASGLLSDVVGKPVFVRNTLPSWVDSDWQTIPGSYRDSLLFAMMYDSDNFIAEQIMLNISYHLWDTLSTFQGIDTMMKSDFSSWTNKIRWVDGSGLSIYNKFTPRFLVELLGQLWAQLPPDVLFQYFPAGGVRGTISSRYGHPEGPYVFAKTGTLSSVHCLSGYLNTDSGNTYIFSMMHNNYLGSSNIYKEKMQIFLEFLKQNY